MRMPMKKVKVAIAVILIMASTVAYWRISQEKLRKNHTIGELHQVSLYLNSYKSETGVYPFLIPSDISIKGFNYHLIADGYSGAVYTNDRFGLYIKDGVFHVSSDVIVSDKTLDAQVISSPQ
jgi:hypothetical protein